MTKTTSKKQIEKKIPRVRWASRGDFEIDPSFVQTMAYCQKLEEQGYGLKPEPGNSERANPFLAVVLPTDRIVEWGELEDFAREHKGKLTTPHQKMFWAAYQYARAYHSD